MKLRDKLLAAKSRRRREPLPADTAALLGLEGSERVFVCEATGRDLDSWQASRVITTFDRDGRSTSRTNLDNVRARLLVYCLVDEDGEYLFRLEDVPALGELPATALDAMYAIALRLNGLSKESEEGPLKNAPGAASSTGSPSSSGGAASNGVCATSAPAS